MKILIVAFDGLDCELVEEEYNLTNIQQNEFGTIDNNTGTKTIVTSELFASFLTGGLWTDHGIVGLGRYRNEMLNKIESLTKYRGFRKFTGLRNSFYRSLPLLDARKTAVTKKDLNSGTFFEFFSRSKAIDVPAYSIGYNVDLMSLLEEHGVAAALEDLNRFTRWKKQELFDSMEADYDLVMAHFHKADHIHHWFWEVGKMDKVEETYHEMDELAAEIKRKADKEGFDTVLFMSDHRLPDVENGGHNKNAFYSCNRELFGDKTPHITDFHDKILALTDSDVSDVDV